MSITQISTDTRMNDEILKLQQFALDNISEAVFLSDENAQIRYVNEAACKHLGYTNEELLNMSVFDINPITSDDEIQNIWNKIKTGSNVSLIETQHKTKDGTIIPVEININYFEYNGTSYSMSFVKNITKRKQEQKQLQETQTKLASIIDTLPDLIWLKDKDGFYLSCNSAFEQYCGKPESEVIGKTDDDFFTKEGAQRCKQSDMEALVSNALTITKEEFLYPQDATTGVLEIRKTPVYKSNGELLGVLGIGRDITKNLHAKQQLLQALEFNQNIIDAIPDLLFEISFEGIYINVWARDTNLLAMQKKFLLGKNIRDIVPNDVVEVVLKTIEEIERNGSSHGNIYQLDLLDGTHWFELSATKKKSGGTYLLSSRDITDRKEAENKLKEKSDLLEAVLESAHGIITFALDVNYCYMAFDSKHADVMRSIWGKEIVVGMNMLDVISSDDDREKAKKSFDRALSGEKFVVEEVYGEENASRLYWQIFYAPIVSANGKTIGLTCFNLDITERKQTDELLRKKEQEFRSLAENLPDNIARWDTEGRYLYINPTHERLLGMTLSEIVGTFIPESHTKVKAAFAQVVATQEKVTIRQEVPGKNGEMEIHDVSLAPEFDEHGEVVSILGIGRDMTELMHSEEYLKKTKAKLAAVISTIPDLIWVKDANGVYMMCNPAFENFFGAECGEIVGKTDYDFISKEQADFFTQKDREAMDAGVMCINEEEIVFAHNSQRALLETRKIPVYNGDAFMGVLGIGRDITERKEMETSLEKYSTSLAEAQRVSHTGSWELNFETNALFWSDEVFRIFEIDQNKFSASYEGFLEAIHPDDRDMVSHAFSEALAAQTYYEIEHRLLMSDGRIKHVLERGETKYSDEGKPLSTLGIVHDITERKEMEAQIIKQKDFQDTLLLGVAKAGLGVHVIEDGKYIYTNDIEKAKKYGYDETISDVKPNFLDTIHPADRAKALDMYTRRMTGEDVTNNYELRVVQTDGTAKEHSVSIATIPDTSPLQTIVIAQDITERKRLDMELKENEKRLKEAQKIAKLGSWELEFPSMKFHWSNEMYNIFEISSDEGEPSYEYFLNFIHPEDKISVNEAYQESLKNKTTYDLVHRLLLSNNKVKYVHVKGETFYDAQGDALRSIGTVQDINEQKITEKRIEHMAHHDALTGLPNRVLAKNRVQQAITVARQNNSKTALLFLDLDGFKTVNDSMGHSMGDKVLKLVTSRIKDTIKEGDTISRQGGDEFLIILSGINDTQEIVTVIKDLLYKFEKPFDINGHAVSTSASIGIAVYPEHGDSFESLLQNADIAMYEAKENGKNTYSFYTEKMNRNILQRFQIQNDLKYALKNNEFELYYQPQIDLDSNTIIGAEALIRWKHPLLGIIPPLNFIPIAESSGTIVNIGEWVINEACRQAVRWGKQGITMSIAVNISGVQFKRGNLEEIVTKALNASGLDPRFLELELTESIMINDAENVLATLQALKALGIKLSIDDFGTGYSSLTYLKRFAIDKLKIDKSFINSILGENEDATIVQTIIQMAKNLNLKTIAEGVETKEILDIVHFLGCDEVQGYYFSKPMESIAFEHFYKEF
ncbi:PAS domain S-box protein [bacterium]|nr:PAS domain S-box protein [bacterium]